MLSRLSGGECTEEPQQTEVCVINSNRIEAKHSSVDKTKDESLPKLNLPDMVKEQQQDPQLKKKSLERP